MTDWVADATALLDWWKCPEHYRLKHVKGLQLADVVSWPLIGGQALHKAREHWFSLSSSDIGGSIDVLREHWPEAPLEDQHRSYNLPNATAVWECYGEKFPRESDPFEVLATEQVLRHNFGPFDYCGIIDTIVRFEDGRVLPFDLKTSGSYKPTPDQARTGYSGQMLGYAALLEAKGHGDVSGYMIDAMFLPWRKAGPSVDDVDRFEGQIMPWQKEAWRGQTQELIDEIEGWRALPRARWHQNERSCLEYGGCPYLPLCQVSEQALDREIAAHYIEGPRWEPWKEAK